MAQDNQALRRHSTGAHRRLWPLVALMLVNMACYAGLCAFWQYTSTGRWADLSPAGMQRGLSMPLGRLFVDGPVGIFEYRWMILVAGLALAAMAAIPAAAASFYSLPGLLAAAVYATLLAVLGQAPAMALSVVFGCVAAALAAARGASRFAAALAALAPVGVYLYLSTYFGTDSAALPPAQRWMIAAPPVAAILAAALWLLVVVGLSAWTRRNPAAIWLSLTVLLAAGPALFYSKIGAAEVDYAVLTADLAPNDAVFGSFALDPWERRDGGLSARGTQTAPEFSGAEGLSLQSREARVRDNLSVRKTELLDKCKAFLASHPASPRKPMVMWLAAQCRSLQFDEQRLKAGLVSYTADWASPDSQEAWRDLLDQCPDSPQAVIARWRLGQFALRRRDVAEAIKFLVEAVKGIQAMDEAQFSPPAARPVALPNAAPDAAYYDDALFKAGRLLWLIEQNDLLADAESARAMAAYLSLNPHSADYFRQLAALLNDANNGFERTKVADNLRLAVAKETPDLYERAEMLSWLAQENTDAAVEANYELGQLVTQEPALQLKSGISSPETYFKLVRDAPANPWAPLAMERLKWLGTTRPGK